MPVAPGAAADVVMAGVPDPTVDDDDDDDNDDVVVMAPATAAAATPRPPLSCWRLLASVVMNEVAVEEEGAVGCELKMAAVAAAALTATVGVDVVDGVGSL